MLKRSGTGWMDGFYSLPAGGLEYGETLATAAIREACEETGVIISQDSVSLAHTMHVFTEQRSWIGQFFICTEWRRTPYLAEPDKHAEIVWRPLHDIPEDTVPYVRQAIENIQNECPYSEFGWNESH